MTESHTACGARQNWEDADENTQQRVDTDEHLVDNTRRVTSVVDEEQDSGNDSCDH